MSDYYTLKGLNRVIVTARLKRCPFCQHDAGFEELRYRGTMASGMEAPDLRVVCTNQECGVTTKQFPTSIWTKGKGHKSIREATEQVLIGIWNTRHDV